MLGYRRDELVGGKWWETEPLRDLPDVKSTLERMRVQDVAALPRPAAEIQEHPRGACGTGGQRVRGKRNEA